MTVYQNKLLLPIHKIVYLFTMSIWKDKLVKQEKQGSLIHSYHFSLTSVLTLFVIEPFHNLTMFTVLPSWWFFNKEKPFRMCQKHLKSFENHFLKSAPLDFWHVTVDCCLILSLKETAPFLVSMAYIFIMFPVHHDVYFERHFPMGNAFWNKNPIFYLCKRLLLSSFVSFHCTFWPINFQQHSMPWPSAHKWRRLFIR